MTNLENSKFLSTEIPRSSRGMAEREILGSSWGMTQNTQVGGFYRDCSLFFQSLAMTKILEFLGSYIKNIF